MLDKKRYSGSNYKNGSMKKIPLTFMKSELKPIGNIHLLIGITLTPNKYAKRSLSRNKSPCGTYANKVFHNNRSQHPDIFLSIHFILL